MGIRADVMSADLKHVSCIVCGGSSRRIRSGNAKPLFRCSECALFFFSIEQLPESLYDGAYSGKVVDGSFEEFHFRAQYLARLSRTEFLLPPSQQLSLRWLTAHAAPGSTVLDVGCGWGAMLRALRARNYRALGLDLSQRVADTLGRQGFQIHVGPVDSYPSSLPDPAVVTCNFVLHHPADPLAFLRSIRDRFPHAPLLLTEGLYPNWMHELPGWLRSSVWRPPVDYPRDVTQWSASALSIALRRSGYRAHTLIYAPPSADDVQLPLSVWAGRLIAARSRSGTPGHRQPLRIPGLSPAIRTTLLLKRRLYAAHAAYATRRRLTPASVLALAYGERA